MPLPAPETILSEGAEHLGFDLPPAQIEYLLEYLTLLEQWNRTMNLVGPAPVAEWAIRHLLDSLTILRQFEPAGDVVDLGSGAGLPGIPLKIARPELPIMLVEPTRKRHSFLLRVIARLRLASIAVRNCRIHDLEHSFHTVISRAVWPPQNYAELAAPLVKPGGRLILMSSHPVDTPAPLEKWARRDDRIVLPWLQLPRTVTCFLRPETDEH